MGEKLVKDMEMIGDDGLEREESAWAECLSTVDAGIPPVRPHLEALLRTDWRQVQTQNVAPSDRSLFLTVLRANSD